jgi:starvation-inducible DNA-binding protein
MAINIGIPAKDRKAVAEGLSKILADSYTLYLKTHNYHWNVTEPMFNTLHQMFETQYSELALPVDEIAERIRALGVFAPGSYKAFAKLTDIKEENSVPSTEKMIRELVKGQETIIRAARKVIPLAESVNDNPSADLLIQRIQLHEKNAWMLRSLLEN